MSNRVVIVGGGISGLALAYRLRQAQPDADVTVLEAANRPGGNIWTDRADGFQLETGPNGFLDNNPATVRLCHDLGLADRLIPASEASARNRYLFLDGKLHALPAGLGAFVRSGLLSVPAKIRLVMESWWPRNRPAGDESVAAMARRRGGRAAAEVFADALVTGIHGGDPELLSARAAFPRVDRMEAESGSVVRGMSREAKRKRAEAKDRGEPPPQRQRMWSFRGGLRVLIEALRDNLASPPVCGVTVRSVRRDGAGWRVAGDGRDAWDADAVVLACPAREQAELLADTDSKLAEDVAGIAYCGIAVVALGYRAGDAKGPTDGFGYIAPQRTRRDLLGVQWCSSIFPDRAPPGTVLWRALCGGWNRPDQLSWSDERLFDAVRAELRLAQGVTAEPVFRRVIRWPRAIPQYHIGHLDRVARIESAAARHPGLFLAGNAYHGIAVNDCTEQAEVLARCVAAFRNSECPPS
jgi:oxygen-dependent protoporphyrinogen oxidase